VVLEKKDFSADAPISVSNLAAKFVDQDELEQALIEAAEAHEAAEEAQKRVAELELEVSAKAGQ
jgi:predicted RNA-binding protein associated with RNAse of E/G family